VIATAIEAVCDDQNRPLALWLRTPEPLDWRRVHVDFTLRHVEPDAGCPTAYANRDPMTLAVELLPSTDGSGTLLVASLAGTPTRLPRGEVTLQLRYEPVTPGQVPLRRRAPAPPFAAESVSLTFLQPLGRTWPVKPTKSVKPLKIPKLIPKKWPLKVPDPDPWLPVIEFLKRGR
jgi:hypothetical protein